MRIAVGTPPSCLLSAYQRHIYHAKAMRTLPNSVHPKSFVSTRVATTIATEPASHDNRIRQYTEFRASLLSFFICSHHLDTQTFNERNKCTRTNMYVVAVDDNYMMTVR